MRDYYRADTHLERQLNYIYRRSHINRRYTCCADFTGETRPTERRIFSSGKPGTEERMRIYAEEISSLAAVACRNALDGQRPFAAADITHLIVVTCTGFYAPGPDLDLVEELGLKRQVQRLQIGFMGCQAALQGLQVADAIYRSDPGALVLLVCAELCTLHFQSEPTKENLIINSLFADGAAAVLIGGEGEGEPLCRLKSFASHLVRETRETVTWRIGNRGYCMGLSLAVPAVIQRTLPGFVDDMLKDAALHRDEVDLWAVHPGGRSILDAAERSLQLEGLSLAGSRKVLRDYGNMSSATVLFALEQVLRDAPASGCKGVALTFGPGLSLEGLVWERG